MVEFFTGLSTLVKLAAFCWLMVSTTRDVATFRSTIEKLIGKGIQCRTFVATAVAQLIWAPDVVPQTRGATYFIPFEHNGVTGH
jgi:hypothetical protein